VDRIYRLAFKNLTNDLNKLEEKLRELMSKNLRLFRYSQTIMVILCVLLTLLAGIMFQRFERRQERAYRSLQHANEQLEKEIAERERSEKAVRASELRYRQLVEELKDFSTAVSHDLRAPLINLKGFSKEIEAALDVTRPVVDAALAELSEKRKKEVAAAFYEDLPEAVDFIDASVAKMERLINSILKLSRLDRRELKPETLDMKKIVQDTLKSLGHQIKARGIEVSVGNLPETRADKVAMEQILSNLLSNAINYLDPGRTGKIEITGESRPDENVFQIRDNGRGIQKFDIEKVFNLFERLGNDSAAGEGMGLAYVRALVRRHGGDVFCESEYGAGSKFTFTISKRIV
jgi:signal transduction histidine kinase